jgi:hypothetical protein
MEPLIHAAGGDKNIPEHELTLIKCVRTARELCWIIELNTVNDKLNLIARFEELLVLLPEHYSAILRPWMLEYAASKPFICPSVSVESEVQSDFISSSDLLSEERRSDADILEVPLEVCEVNKMVTNAVLAGAKGDDNFEFKLKQLITWQQRANILNSSWRAIFTITEEWTALPMHPLMLGETVGVYVDNYAIKDMVYRIESHYSDESNTQLRNLIKYVTEGLQETDRSCTTLKQKGRDYFLNTEERFYLDVDSISHLQDCSSSFKSLDKKLGVLEKAVFSSKRGCRLADGKCYLICRAIKAPQTLSFELCSSDSDDCIKIAGNIMVGLLICFMIAILFETYNKNIYRLCKH